MLVKFRIRFPRLVRVLVITYIAGIILAGVIIVVTFCN